MRVLKIAICLGLLASLPGLALTVHAAGYDVTVLQEPADQIQGVYHASVQSAGSSIAGRGEETVLWSASGQLMVLQEIGGRSGSDAVAINDAGQTVEQFDPQRAAAMSCCGRLRGPRRSFAT